MEQTNPQIYTHTHVKTHKMINKSSQKFVIHIILHHYWFNQRDKWTLQRNLIIIFFLSGFSFTDTDSSQDSRGREGTIFFHSATSTRSRTFRHLFATLHVRWLSHIFNRNACIYQAATLWHLPPYRITIWLIDDVILIFVCLHFELILGFLIQLYDMRNR